MLRFDHDRSWAIRLGDGRVLGALPLVLPSSCAAAGAYLACPTADRNLTVWAAA
jgi:hypothetical protein